MYYRDLAGILCGAIQGYYTWRYYMGYDTDWTRLRYSMGYYKDIVYRHTVSGIRGML